MESLKRFETTVSLIAVSNSEVTVIYPFSSNSQINDCVLYSG